LCLEPGITNANAKVVRVDIQAEKNLVPIQHLEEDEDIQVMKVPVDKLLETLTEFSKTCVVDAKLWTFSYALQMTKQM